MARVKDFVDTQNFTKEELLDMVNVGLLMKENLKKGFSFKCFIS